MDHAAFLIHKSKSTVMKKQIILPIQSQEKLFSLFIEKLVEKFNPLHIYCFGKIVETSNEEGSFTTTTSKENYQYFLLMVTESATIIEHEVQDFTNKVYQSGAITVLAHSKNAISGAIKANSRFFITIHNTAKIVYSKDDQLQPTSSVEFIPTFTVLKAQKKYDYHMELAQGFLKSAKECFDHQVFHLSVFMLHQSVEQCCHSLIRVVLGYRSNIHNLNRQLRLCNCFSYEPSQLFLSTAEDRRLFDIMIESYSAARYKDDFKVEKADAEKLLNHVSNFLALTEKICKHKIQMLSAIAEQYKQLKPEMEVCDVS